MAKQTVNQNNDKHLFYGRNVLQQIITLAVNEISGVCGVTSKNIVFVQSGKVMTVDVTLPLKYGHGASDVAFRVQENIKRSVETMTDYRVDRVNVRITGVVLDEGN